jgi:aspartyl-tRNA(Asn)/glutamyl-tRNA(Gln) amidotransferase subunit B
LKESGAPAKVANNWVNVEVSAVVNDLKRDFANPPFGAVETGRLIRLLVNGEVSGKAAKQVLIAMAEGEGDPAAIIARRGLAQISDENVVEAAVARALAENPKLVADYRAGKDKAFNALVGKVMSATQGKANPARVSALLRAKLSSS